MSPYRITAQRADSEAFEAAAVDDDSVLAIVMLLIAGPRLVLALAEHEVFATESTMALFMVALAIGLLLRRR
jgi:hypothetical protein